MTSKEFKSLKPILIQAHECPLCHKLSKDANLIESHVKSCANKAYLNDLATRNEAKRKEGMDFVRLNATSPSHALNLLIEYAKSVGLNVTLTFSYTYPMFHLTDVRNSHGAPIDFPMVWPSDNKLKNPESYPGFSGQWKGSIKGKCPMKNCYDKNEPTISCLFEHVVNGFHTGTGSSGEDFDFL